MFLETHREVFRVKRMKEKKRAKMVTVHPCSHHRFLGERHPGILSVFLWQLFCNPETASIFFFGEKNFIYENLEQYKTPEAPPGATTSNF